MVVDRASSASSITSFLGDRGRGLGHQQLLGVRGLVVDGDPHVGQHRDHALDLLGVGHVVRQVVVDLGVREVAAILAEDDEVLQALFLGLDLGLLDLGLVLVRVVVLAGFLCCHGAPAGRFGKTVNSIRVLTAPPGTDSRTLRWPGGLRSRRIRPSRRRLRSRPSSAQSCSLRRRRGFLQPLDQAVHLGSIIEIGASACFKRGSCSASLITRPMLGAFEVSTSLPQFRSDLRGKRPNVA
jgi:hypothetical protein